MTPGEPKFDPGLSKNRWVACFDLLGIRSKLAGGNASQVFFDYTAVLKEATSNRLDQVNFFWFSDTFVFYTGQSSRSDFVWLESKARWFCYFLVVRQIAVRGAISSGSMYADPAHSLFFGQALIEAYDYAESQNWIGLILTPSAAGRCGELGHPLRSNYANWEVPFKESLLACDTRAKAPLPACLFAGPRRIPPGSPDSRRDLCLAKLESMREAAGTKHAVKYDNTLGFLNQNR